MNSLMADEKKPDPHEIDQIMSDLDKILKTPASPQKPAAASAPPPAGKPPAGGGIPEHVSKTQVRRVAILHSPGLTQKKDEMLAFLGECARSAAKNPIYLLVVLTGEAPAVDPAAFAKRARELAAAAVIALVDGLPEPKLAAYAQAASASKLRFHALSPAAIGQRALGMDVVVDLMLASGDVD